MRRTPRRYATVTELVSVIRYEWRSRRSWKSHHALLRGLWWSLVRRYPCELCQRCGCPVGLGLGDTYWHGSDSLWVDVAGWDDWEQQVGELAYLGPPGTLCAACFTMQGREKGIHIWWQPRTSEERISQMSRTPIHLDSPAGRAVNALWSVGWSPAEIADAFGVSPGQIDTGHAAEQRMYPRYRAVVVDRDQDGDALEYGNIISSRYLAEMELAEMMREANPSFDEGWIEVCRITNWERAPQ